MKPTPSEVTVLQCGDETESLYPHTAWPPSQVTGELGGVVPELRRPSLTTNLGGGGGGGGGGGEGKEEEVEEEEVEEELITHKKCVVCKPVTHRPVSDLTLPPSVLITIRVGTSTEGGRKTREEGEREGGSLMAFADTAVHVHVYLYIE